MCVLVCLAGEAVKVTKTMNTSASTATTQSDNTDNKDKDNSKDNSKDDNNKPATSSCVCEKKLSKKQKRNKKNKKKGFQMNCFTMSKDHWKTKPLWTGTFIINGLSRGVNYSKKSRTLYLKNQKNQHQK